jgi:hypothetical protein
MLIIVDLAEWGLTQQVASRHPSHGAKSRSLGGLRHDCDLFKRGDFLGLSSGLEQDRIDAIEDFEE